MPEVQLSIVVILAALGVAGLLVLVLAGIRVSHRLPILDPTNKPIPVVNWVSCVLAACWLAYSLVGVVSQPVAATTVPTLQDLQNGCLFRVLLFLGLFVPLTYPDGPDVSELGFHFCDWKKQFTDGVLGFLAAVIPVLLVLGVMLPFRSEQTAHPILQMLQQDSSFVTLFWVVIAAIVLAPLVEEILYRVVIQSWLQRVSGERVGLLVTAFLFAGVHRLPDAIPLIPLALILGYVYQQRRCFLTVVLIHILFNGTNLLFALLSR